MHKNILSYWRDLENLPDGHRDKPTPRICNLLQEMFEKWHTKPPWIKQDGLGHLFDYYKNKSEIKSKSVIERKGLAIQKTLELLTRKEINFNGGTIKIHPLEIIVGTLPPYSVGQGKEVMRYLTADESLQNEINYLNEWSPFGHTVPDHSIVLEKGTMGVIEDCQKKIKQSKSKKSISFYKAVISSMKGINHYANAIAERCNSISKNLPSDSFEARNMAQVSERLQNIPANPAKSFLDALQGIYLIHCALHFTGEIVPIGRLDQLLFSYYQKDLKAKKISKEEAQEAIDAFWIKLDEKAILNRRFAEDRFTSSDGALLGTSGPSNFDQGALLNQWMQQITIGGVIANNNKVAVDASNDITEMCLNSARKLPLNSPTLNLRVHSKTKKKYIELASEALLKGGAHPVLLNDDKIVPALHKKTGGYVELASARNYACDGCYETLFAGETEFSFGFVPALDVLGKALNSGAGLSGAGSSSLRGRKDSYRTTDHKEIKSYEAFYKVLKQHLLIGCHKFYNGILAQYGIKEEVSPSPLLSALIGGCMESGRDISGGGARYKLFSPLMTGISTAVDSLYVIKKLVFEEQFMSLEELVSCLKSNWDKEKEITGFKIEDTRIKEIREKCLEQNKFGFGNRDVDEIAWKLIQDFYDALTEARNSPLHKKQWETLRSKYDQGDSKFDILVAPGVGTFEQYNFGGSFTGATADGRFASDPIASDFSPSPIHTDIDPLSTEENMQLNSSLEQCFKSYNNESINLLSDGAPSDLNIPENFKLSQLVSSLKKFADGEGGNILTITVGDAATFTKAQENPEDYNLLRVRMGGWTEFFITLFPNHQEQHKRRPTFNN